MRHQSQDASEVERRLCPGLQSDSGVQWSSATAEEAPAMSYPGGNLVEVSRLEDHNYHRSRVDAHITGNIVFVAAMVVMALLIGDQFKPFQHGAKWLDPVRLVWVERDQDWVAESILVDSATFPPVDNTGPVITVMIYPIVLSAVLVLGSLAIAYFIYTAARRQTRLMHDVYAGAADRPYDRPWNEIRVTFWALDVALLFALFLFLM